MKKTIALAGLFAGCAHYSGQRPDDLVNAKLDVIVKVMGYPTSQRVFEDDTVYSWNSSYIKARWIFIHTRETCTMDVGTRNGVVKSIRFNGDEGPCEELKDQLLAR